MDDAKSKGLGLLPLPLNEATRNKNKENRRKLENLFFRSSKDYIKYIASVTAK